MRTPVMTMTTAMTAFQCFPSWIPVFRQNCSMCVFPLELPAVRRPHARRHVGRHEP